MHANQVSTLACLSQGVSRFGFAHGDHHVDDAQPRSTRPSVPRLPLTPLNHQATPPLSSRAARKPSFISRTPGSATPSSGRPPHEPRDATPGQRLGYRLTSPHAGALSTPRASVRASTPRLAGGSTPREAPGAMSRASPSPAEPPTLTDFHATQVFLGIVAGYMGCIRAIFVCTCILKFALAADCPRAAPDIHCA